MLKLISYDDDHPIDINSQKTLIAAIYLGIIGPAIFIIQPAFVQGLVELFNYSEQGAGYVAAAEMWGIALSTFVMTFLSHKVNWRNILTIATIIIGAGNLASIFVDGAVSFAIVRCITGIGSGVLVSLTFTIIGMTSNPARNFGLLIMWILVYGAVGFLLMPTAYKLVGMEGVLVFFALFSLSALMFIRFIPVSGQEHFQPDENTVDLSILLKSFAIAAMFVYFVAQGVVWAYLFLIGTTGGATEQEVANGLTLSQFFGIAGALLAAIAGIRFAPINSLSVGILGSVISLLFLLGQIDWLIYGAAVCLFNFAWNMTHPFLLATMTTFDRSGRIVSHAVAAQMIGLAVGPALAASVITEGDYSKVIWLGIILFIVSLLIIIPPIRKHKALKLLSGY